MKFSCPKCGNTVLKTNAKPRTIKDFDGSVCSNCGHRISEDDINAQILDLAENQMRDAFKGAKFTK